MSAPRLGHYHERQPRPGSSEQLGASLAYMLREFDRPKFNEAAAAIDAHRQGRELAELDRFWTHLSLLEVPEGAQYWAYHYAYNPDISKQMWCFFVACGGTGDEMELRLARQVLTMTIGESLKKARERKVPRY